MRSSASIAKIDGNVTFENNTADVYLASGKTFTLTDAYTADHVITVGVADTVSANTKRQITTGNTSTKAMLEHVTAASSGYDVRYDNSGYLYLWKHSHTWNYTASGDTITAKCTTDTDCRYYNSGLTLKLKAPEVQTEGDGKSCTATVENGLGVTGASVGSVYYEGVNGTTYTKSTTAPTTAGTYKATVTVGGKTAEVTYTIKAKTYGITVEDGTADKTEAAKGETITLTVDKTKAPTGQEFDYWTVNGKKIDGNTFTMPDGKAEVKAVYKNIDYAVNVTGGAAWVNNAETTTAQYKQTVTLKVDDIKIPDGQEFDYWTLDGTKIEGDSFEMPAKAVEVKAVYKKKGYTVTITGGTTDETTYTEGETVTLTEDTKQTPAGKKLVGWIVNGTEQTGNTFTMPKGNVTVTPKYDFIDYTVTVKDGDTTTKVTKTAHIDEEITIPAAKGKTGHTFKEWQATGLTSATVAADAATITMGASNVTLTAVYEANKHTLNVNNGETDKEPATKAYDTTVELTAEDVEGKTFTGWSVVSADGKTVYADTPDKTVTFQMPDSDVNAVAHYSEDAEVQDKHFLTVSNGEQAEEPSAVETDGNVTLTAKEVPGKTFAKWTVEGVANLTESTSKELTFTMPGNDVTVTAVYDFIDYTVTVKDEAGNELKKVEGAHIGDEITLPSAPAKKGYTFTGWKDANSSTVPASQTEITVGTSDITLTAVYEINQYTLTVKTETILLNSDDTEIVTKETSDKNYDTEVTLTADEIEGKVFMGWTVEGLEDAIDTPDREITFNMPAGNVTAVAHYCEDSSAPVNNEQYLNVNNGEQAEEPTTVEIEKEVSLTAKAVPGKTFTKWTVEGVDVADDTAKTLTFKMPGNDVSVTAVYDFIDYTVTVKDEAGSELKKVEGAHIGDTVTLPEAPAKKGYTFTGWKNTEDDSTVPVSETEITVGTSDITLTPEYELTKYTLTVNTATIFNDESTKTVTEKTYTDKIYEETVELTAEDVEGKTFNGWSVESADGTILADTPDKTVTFQMPDGDVTATAHYYQESNTEVNNEHYLTVQNGEQDEETSIVEMGKEVTLFADDVEGKIFTGWTVDGLTDFNETPSLVLTFTMPGNDVTAIAHYRDDDPGQPVVTSDGTAAAVVGATVLAGIVGVQAYALGTEAYIRLAMPAGIVLPSNRMEMALLIWEQAGEPEPTSTELFEDIDAEDTDAQKAARWMVEQELMKVDEDKPTEFHPLKAVTRLRICLTWHDAKEKGLVK